MSEINEKRIEKSVKLWPFLYAISCDLLFFWVVNVAFLTSVKGLDYSSFFTLDVVAGVISIALSYPILVIISKVGNNLSFKIGSALMITSFALFIFGTKFMTFAIANTLYYFGYNFLIVSPLILENNLDLINKKDKFLKYSARGKFYYAILLAIIALVSGVLYDINPYLPMLIGLSIAILGFLLSFYVYDHSKSKCDNVSQMKGLKIGNKKLIIFTIAFMAFILIFNGSWFIANQYTKISLQDIGANMQLVAFVLFIARSIRAISNLFNDKIVEKFKIKLGYYIVAFLVLSLLLLALPIVLIDNYIIQVVLISIGVVLVLVLRDLGLLYYQYVTIINYENSKHTKMFWMLDVFETMGVVISNLLVALLITQMSSSITLLVLSLVTILCFIPTMIMIVINRKLKQAEAKPSEDENNLIE